MLTSLSHGFFDVTIACLDPEDVGTDILHALFVQILIMMLTLPLPMAAILDFWLYKNLPYSGRGRGLIILTRHRKLSIDIKSAR